MYSLTVSDAPCFLDRNSNSARTGFAGRSKRALTFSAKSSYVSVDATGAAELAYEDSGSFAAK